jgi:RepB plasmid partitioning protein/ParB-like nuclease domain
MSTASIAFEMMRTTLPVDRILPVRMIKEPEKKGLRKGTILSTIREAGLIEPLMVYPQKGNTGFYVLTDGHLRLAAYKELGFTEVECIVALDDECYTYNAKINRLAPIQERQMILNAVANGVPVERIAAALNLDPSAIRARISVTDGLCPDVVDMLKDKQMSPDTLKMLRKVVPSRQIEIVELMVAANNYTRVYVEALLFGTPKNKLSPAANKNVRKIKPEEVARMEMEMESLEKEYKICEQGFSEKMLQLTVFRRYVMRLLENSKVNRFLGNRHAEIHAELSAIVASETVC